MSNIDWNDRESYMGEPVPGETREQSLKRLDILNKNIEKVQKERQFAINEYLMKAMGWMVVSQVLLWALIVYKLLKG